MNLRINPDSFYVDGVNLLTAFWQALDTAQSQAWNGDVGSSHNPTSPITIGGAGMWICGPSAFYGNTGNKGIYNIAGSGTRITHGDNDWIGLQPGGTNAIRLLMRSLGSARDNSFTVPIAPGGTYPTLTRFRFLSQANADGLSSSDSVQNWDPDALYYTGGRFTCPIRLHHNATLQSVSFFFKIGDLHVGLPASQPQFRVISVDASGNVTPLLTNTASAGWVGNGFVQLHAPTPSIYYNSGLPQSFIYNVDAGVVVDITKYNYFVQVIDESDVISGLSLGNNTYLGVGVTMINIPDLQPGG